MKRLKYTLICCITIFTTQLFAQENENYIQFDDSQNIVNGVYLGLNFGYREMDGKSTYFGGGKIDFLLEV